MPDYENDENVYEDTEDLLEDDEIDGQEAAFMRGYEKAGENEKEADEDEGEEE